MLKIANLFKFASRRYSSALYITGDKAQNNYVVLVPYMNFEKQLEHRDELQKNISARKLNINLEQLEKRWAFYRTIDAHKKILEITRSEVFKELQELKNNPEENKEEIRKLNLHADLLKHEYTSCRDYSYGIEEDTAIQILKLPNILHEKTPVNENNIIYEFLQKPNHESDSHITNKNVEYHDPMFYYLTSDVAMFEYALSNYFQDNLKTMNYNIISNADFVRSLIIDGCGKSYIDNENVFTLEDPHDRPSELNRLHLVGGASIEAFMAYFARHSIQPTFLPLKLFTLGRKYQPKPENKQTLFNLSQSTVVQTFIVIPDDAVLFNDMITNIIEQCKILYEPLGYHFRLVLVRAEELDVSESLRLSIQMYSNFCKDYVQVGSVSIYDDYLSKRLLLSYQNAKKERIFPKVISGDVVNLQKFIGCALENRNNINTSLLSEMLYKYI